MNRYKIIDSFFVNTDEKWIRIKYNEIKFLRVFENSTAIFLTNDRIILANHQLSAIAKMLSNNPNFVRINRTEIVNVDYIDGFKDNCYYIDKNSFFATSDYKTYLEEHFKDITIHE